MKTRYSISLVALATVSWAGAATAQQNDAAVERELAAMRAEMAQMTQRIATLEAELAAAKAPAAPAPAVASSPPRETTIAWKGAPELATSGGFTFKPRGRIQIDAGGIGAPRGITDRSAGFGSEVRRAYLGFEGKIPGGFGYRAEIDVAASAVEITDLYLTYQPSPPLTLTIGQHKPFWGLEELTSDVFTSFTERAAANTAFGYERRLGASVAWTKGPLLVQGGAFTDNAADLNDDENHAWSLDGRAVFMPKLAGGQFHLGGSVHYREANDPAASVRYRVRPFIHTPDIRFIDTGAIGASGETGYGLETAYIRGPLDLSGEAHWQHVDRRAGGPGSADPTFFGAYAQLGYFLTPGDTRSYKAGVFDRIKPVHPVGKGGIGAIQANLRYDRLDLDDAGIVGGTQDGYEASLVWVPTDYTRLVFNYGRLNYRHAAIPAAGGDRDYAVDAFGMRAQIDY